MPEKIQQVKAPILERRRQLDHENGGRVEKIALHDALAIIRIMERDKLSSSMLDEVFATTVRESSTSAKH